MVMVKSDRGNLTKDQSGIVAITVTMVVMFIVILVVSSFALIVRREQRQALDRQLSSQAFYAAEAGIQDAQFAMSNGDASKKITTDITDCNGFNAASVAKGLKYSQTLDANVKYSCLLIDRSPYDLKYSIPQEKGTVIIPIKATSISSLQISWQSLEGGGFTQDNSPAFDLPQGSTGLNSPLLRVSLMRGFSGQPLTRAQMTASSHTMFLYPNYDGAANSYGQINYLNNSGGVTTDPAQGQFVSGRCNPGSLPKYCNVRINNLNLTPAPGSDEEYYLVVKPLYKSADVDVVGYNGGAAVELKGAQAAIDVTGKAADVLKRVEARVPIDEGNNLNLVGGFVPDAALETIQTICKQIEVTASTYKDICDNVEGNLSDPLPVGTPSNGGGPTGGTPGGPDGDAEIGGYESQSNYSANAPDFDFRGDFINNSKIFQSTLQSCKWEWGDGQSQVFPGTARECLGNGTGTVSHPYPDVRALILSTNGAQGCRIYTATLTNTFYASTGIRQATNTFRQYLPRGKANDPPNPVTGQGICDQKYKLYP